MKRLSSSNAMQIVLAVSGMQQFNVLGWPKSSLLHELFGQPNTTKKHVSDSTSGKKANKGNLGNSYISEKAIYWYMELNIFITRISFWGLPWWCSG